MSTEEEALPFIRMIPECGAAAAAVLGLLLKLADLGCPV